MVNPEFQERYLMSSIDPIKLKEKSSSLRFIQSIADFLIKYLPVFIGTIYLIGYGLTSYRLGQYGISATRLIEAQYFIAGFMPGLFLWITLYVIVSVFYYEPFKCNTYLFSWDNVPGYEKKRLLDFLKVEETGKIEIEKIEDGMCIKVRSKEHIFLLRLNDKQSKVKLIKDGVRTCELITKVENHKLHIYNKLGIESIKPFIFYFYISIYIIALIISPIKSELNINIDEFIIENPIYSLIFTVPFGEIGLWIDLLLLKTIAILINLEIQKTKDQIYLYFAKGFDIKKFVISFTKGFDIEKFIIQIKSGIKSYIVFLALPFILLIFLLIFILPLLILSYAFVNGVTFYENVPQAYGGGKPLIVQFYVDSQKTPSNLLDPDIHMNYATSAYTVPLILIFQTSTEYIVLQQGDNDQRAWVLKADVVYAVVVQ